MRKQLLLFLAVFTAGALSAQCDILHVSTSGTSAGTGEATDPMDLVTAFNMVPVGGTIRIATGTYDISTPLSIQNDNIVIEGGFLATQNWDKTSLAGATTINRLAVNAEGSTNAERLVAIYGNGQSGFRLQDITINVPNAYNPGMSLYGLHLTSCDGYSLVRTRVLVGNAGAGSNGINGSVGAAGQNGTMGGSGSCDGNYTCCFGSESAPGGNGGAGGAGGGGTAAGATNSSTTPSNPGSTGTGRNGGGGGAGGKGGGFSGGNNAVNGNNGGGSASVGLNTNVGAAGASADPGGDGSNGTNGSQGANGTNGANGNAGSFVGGYWFPGTQGGIGTDGSGGQGGSGGGGGGRQSCSVCDDGPGNGGSGGGGGGQGGTAGTGGFGGGSAFCLLSIDNGANTNVIQSEFTFGNAGAGGIGGSGGAGGVGGTGAARRTTCSSEIGEGGAGGNGGNGGVGGAGGNGSAGMAYSIFVESGSPFSTTDDAVSLTIQPEIIAKLTQCSNTQILVQDMTLSAGSGLADWTFGAGGSSASPTDNPVSVTYTNVGFNDISNGTEDYIGFINFTCEGYVMNQTETICEGQSVTVGSSVYTTTGSYTDVLTSVSGCDSTVNLNLTVNSVDNTVSISGITLTATQTGATYQWIDCDNGNAVIPGATSQSYTAAANGNYAVIVTINGCSETSDCRLINSVSLDDKSEFINCNVFPNPSNGTFTVELGDVYSKVEVEMTDVAGKKVFKKNYSNVSQIDYNLKVEGGVYYLKLNYLDDKMSVLRIVIE
jgi:hypothetical protein